MTILVKAYQCFKFPLQIAVNVDKTTYFSIKTYVYFL